ncbi:hypothetical protein LGL55_03220 [Clostridium tagluense]|uniref:hypothetical protein n=1 Tax=Clostridium tagluense TaxID=360422 RepID=UPI001C0E4C87|nr:hypothetical protein [Clostridium tagluense]MBU3127843.1 hypothetical protein [Clostridium tagluense]MBW9157384.1 hypothetical protein [Clostridium tagluense]MCB2310130.1 hypothetical protein [Clostridium tagluense]MCB2315228.1 hypothetical protein [Clostridium tagluense]MCB2319830.1 hypothetical protein [Clostridium tagluense]
MIKKKMLAIGMGCLISMASVIPAFALENVVKDTAVKQFKIERNRENIAERRLRLQETAVKLGLNIEGLSLSGLTTKIEEDYNSKLGVDISNVSKEFDAVKKEKSSEKRREKLREEATKAGVDISGLSNTEATAKINDAKATKQAE